MRFCTNCGRRLSETSRFCNVCGQPISATASPMPSVQRTAPNIPRTNPNVQRTAPQLYNCPRCGAPINSYSAVCGHCGGEILSNVQASSCKELVNKLDQIEASRPEKGFLSVVQGIVNHAMDKSDGLNPTDQRKVELISNYIIANSKVEILDFIMLANSRIKACERVLMSSRSNDEYTQLAQNQLKEIWSTKLAEAMDKADIVLNGDREYLILKNKIMQERALKYKAAGLCMYCGGTFKGVFNKVCISCKRPKNY